MDLNYEPAVFADNTDKLSYEEWKRLRRFGIGGSDAAAVCGVSPWKTARDLYWEKTGEDTKELDERNWVAKQMGKRLEELVVQIFMKRSGLKPYAIRKMFQHPLYPFMLADVDFFVELNGEVYVVECKTSFSYSMEEWEDGKVPYHYELQGIHYMAVLNVAGVIFLCLHGNSEKTYIMRKRKRDLKAEEGLIRQEKHFWEDYVQAGKLPPYTEPSKLVLPSLERSLGLKEGKQIELPAEVQGSVRNYLELKKKKAELDKEGKRLEEQIRQASVPIVEALNGAETGSMLLDGNFYQIGYTSRTTTSISKEQLEILALKYPEIYQEYARTKTTHSFFVKQKKAS